MTKPPRAPRPKQDIDLSVRLGPLQLKNPVVTASGTFGYGLEFLPYLDLGHLGGMVTKGLSLLPRQGNAPPRTCETPSGMLNAIGLANIGVEAFIEERLPELRKHDTVIIANVFGESLEEYVAVARRLNRARGLHAIELNLSCPNTAKGGMAFGVSPPVIREVVAAVRRAAPDLVLIVKLTPNITDISVAARAAQEAGADVLSLVNTFLGMSVDLEARRPVLDNVVGGLSGPAIKPLALYMVHRVHSDVGLPIMGMGGIVTARDALEFIITGSAAVQVGTANFLDPGAAVRILDGIEDYCRGRGIRALRDLVGTLQVPARPSEPGGGV